MKKLFVIDASGYLYRSYHAIRNVTNSKGESTNALFGFIRSTQKLIKDFAPEYLVAVFDGFNSCASREKIYPEYKANRQTTPGDLGYQIGWAQQACQLMGIPFLSLENVEADDTMGTIAVWAETCDFHVYLCSSDKDLCQLVNDKVSILNTFKDNLIIDANGVKENFGVTPAQIIDFLAITGDASDNVPGIPGLGPKTAAALLTEFGSLDQLLSHPEKVSGKKQELLIQHRDSALLSRQLVTLHTDVEIPKDPDFYKIKPIDVKPLKEFYSSMNFNTLIRELDQQEPQKTESVEETCSYIVVDDDESFQELIKLLKEQKEIALVTIGDHSQPLKAHLVGFGFSIAPHASWYLPINGKLGLSILPHLKTLFENPTIAFFGHNTKYDLQLLSNYSIQLANISFDITVASYLLSSHARQHSMDYLMQEHLGKTKHSLSELLGKGKKALTLQQLPIDEMAKVICEEADYVVRLKDLLSKQLEERKLVSLLNKLELPLIRVLARMERKGIFLDKPYLEEIAKEVNRELAILEQEIYTLAGEPFNINSPKQLSHILFTKLGIKPPKKTATGLSTNADVLDSLKEHYPIAGKIAEYRQFEKLRSTYIESLPNDVSSKSERIHCTFNQTVAATGRLSCQDPNLQNIPIRTEAGRRIRGAFRPQKTGWSYLAADYSQIELRLLAHLSEDPELLYAFNHNKDIHTHTASRIFNIPLEQVTKQQRYQAKAVNFGVIYGQQAYGLSQELGIEVKEAAAFIEMYFNQYKRVKEFIEECKEKTRQTGKSLTYTGRERLIPEIHSKNGMIRAAAERLAINTPLQGTAADLIKMAMLNIDSALQKVGALGYMVLQIHDELIFEIPDHEILLLEPLVREKMQTVFQLKVPLVVDITIGKNWAEC